MKIKHAVLPLLVIVLYFYLNLFANALTDDAFITLRYVKTLLNTGTWGFLPGYTTNAVTSPLNVFLLALAGVFLGPTVNAVICCPQVSCHLPLYCLSAYHSIYSRRRFSGIWQQVHWYLTLLLSQRLGSKVYYLSGFIYYLHIFILLTDGPGLL